VKEAERIMQNRTADEEKLIDEVQKLGRENDSMVLTIKELNEKCSNCECGFGTKPMRSMSILDKDNSKNEHL
jgi:hypothetical protein